MTQRLYYDDPYLTRFDAVVEACEATDGGRFLISLDRSAFYPTSGGQPHDQGTLDGANILDVYPDEGGGVVHVTDRALTPGLGIKGAIDWARRFDHMQQHAGDHLMAGVIHRLLRGYTVGLHLGSEFSTIDVVLPDGRTRLEDGEIDLIERLVNDEIQQDLPIRCWFPSEDEMAALPLRKDPSVADHIRVVMMGDAECVACGGTHPSSTGQVALLKILDARPSRGKLRITFVCGMRAVKDYQQKYKAATEAAELLSTSASELPGAVQNLIARAKDSDHQLKKARLDSALKDVPGLLEKAERLREGWKAVSAALDGLDMPLLTEVAATLTREDKTYCLLAGNAQDGAPLVFSRSAGDGVHMGQLLSSVVKPLGGKGGGRDTHAQGAANGQRALDAALTILKTKKCE